MRFDVRFRTSLIFATVAGVGAGGAWWLSTPPSTLPEALTHTPSPRPPTPSSEEAPSSEIDPRTLETASSEARNALADALRARLRGPGIRSDELLISFKDAEAARRFLAHVAPGTLEVLGRIDSIHSLRVKVRDHEALVRALADEVGEVAGISTNPVLSPPTPPPEQRLARQAVAVGDSLPSLLGLSPETDHATLGRGVLVAVLDGGASPDQTLGTRLRYLDIGYGLTGLTSDGAHGTAVASIVAGASPGARGVAPAADLLSIRVVGPDGTSDAFSVARGIHAAIEAGARVINISLGAYATAPILTEAVERALAADVAIVASSGNDQAARLAWPAAYPGVVSVGATDALGQQAIFSNSGQGLQLTAPGVGLSAAGLAGTRQSFSGTSASAPVVSGAIAAVLSRSPELTPLQAADLLASHANDGGAAGADPDYGRGTLNLGWTLDRKNPARVDPAVSSQSYDPSTRTVSFVVQNRGARPVSGLTLDLFLSDAATPHPLPSLAPGASTTVSVSLSANMKASTPSIDVVARLRVPESVEDQDRRNNQLSGRLTLPQP
jgi:hypothetical protein